MQYIDWILASRPKPYEDDFELICPKCGSIDIAIEESIRYIKWQCRTCGEYIFDYKK